MSCYSRWKLKDSVIFYFWGFFISAFVVIAFSFIHKFYQHCVCVLSVILIVIFLPFSFSPTGVLLFSSFLVSLRFHTNSSRLLSSLLPSLLRVYLLCFFSLLVLYDLFPILFSRPPSPHFPQLSIVTASFPLTIFPQLRPSPHHHVSPIFPHYQSSQSSPPTFDRHSTTGYGTFHHSNGLFIPPLPVFYAFPRPFLPCLLSVCFPLLRFPLGVFAVSNTDGNFTFLYIS